MYTIGLYLQIDPDCFDLVMPEIQSMYHIDIVTMEPESGKMMLSVSGDDERQDKQIIDNIRSLPFVMATEIVYFQYTCEGDLVSRTEATADKSAPTYKRYNYILHTQH
ncbi:MAG: chaperone NapD [Gammaproteobacteria bacterium]|jgi:nitrate reductase NapAB chaperone NapD